MKRPDKFKTTVTEWLHRPKYKNRKVTVDGVRFDSVKESLRYCELKILEKAGQISRLKTQVRYELIPKQKKRDGKTERPVDYVADFRYTDMTGRVVVEDTKGVKTRDYIIKRKLMLYVHGIEIVEV